MTDCPPDPDRDTSGDSGGYPGTPRWVKVFGIIVIVLVLVFVVVHLMGGGLGDHSR
jgi:hypothetical protein